MSSQKLRANWHQTSQDILPCLLTKRLFQRHARQLLISAGVLHAGGWLENRDAVSLTDFHYNTRFVLIKREIIMSQITTVSGLQYEDKVEGSGAEATAGKNVSVDPFLRPTGEDVAERE